MPPEEMPNDLPGSDATSAELHLSCNICSSIFLVDTPDEAEAVATPCGHVFHRDCVERIMAVQPLPQCAICGKALPADPTGLLKLFLALDETDYDKELNESVRRATNYDNHALEAAAVEAECREKIQALRGEQEYNQALLASLETQWASLDKINAAAQARVKALEAELAQAEEKVRQLEDALTPA